jgi:hypothetical protein
VGRGEVYRIVARSIPAVLSNAALSRWLDSAFREAEAACAGHPVC